MHTMGRCAGGLEAQRCYRCIHGGLAVASLDYAPEDFVFELIYFVQGRIQSGMHLRQRHSGVHCKHCRELEVLVLINEQLL